MHLVNAFMLNMQNVIVPNVIMLNVIVLNVIIPNVIMLSVIMLPVIMLIVIMLNLLKVMEQCPLRNVNNFLYTNVYSYLETSGGINYNTYLNVVYFFNARVN